MVDTRAVLDSVRIVHFTDERIDDPQAKRQPVTWQAYHTARNAIVRACRRHGRTGPMGECPIREGNDLPDEWTVGDEDPALFVLDDQLNYERYVYLETLGAAVVGPALVADLIATLGTLPGWGLGVNDIRNGYLLLFATHALVSGPAFERASDIDGVILVWHAAVKAG